MTDTHIPATRTHSWEPIDLAELEQRPPVTPDIGGLMYPGRRHIFSGPPESAKTFAAFCLAADQIREGHNVLHIDFEMFAYETRDRLQAMGLTTTELRQFIHVEPETPASDDAIMALIDRYEPRFAIIDAAAGAFALEQLDDGKRQDAELFGRIFIEPFRARNICTDVLDHVTKNRDTRAGFAIGSERKIGGADVHLGFDTIVPLGRGRTGLIKITVWKDRFGYLTRPHPCELEIRSDPETYRVTWQFRTVEQQTDEWHPTALMEKVSRYLEQQTEPVSRNTIEQNVTGKTKFIRHAIDQLITQKYAFEAIGTRGSRLLTSSRPYHATSSPTSSPQKTPIPGENATSSHLVPTSSHQMVPTSSHLVPPPTGGTRTGGRSQNDEHTSNGWHLFDDSEPNPEETDPF